MKKVLLVDDSTVTRLVLKDLLAKFNIDILEANNGNDAIELILSEKVDLVIMDLLMPEKSGTDVLREINTLSLTDTLPVIILSADIQKPTKNLCLELGAVEFFPKPIPMKELSVYVEKYLNGE